MIFASEAGGAYARRPSLRTEIERALEIAVRHETDTLVLTDSVVRAVGLSEGPGGEERLSRSSLPRPNQSPGYRGALSEFTAPTHRGMIRC